MKGETTFAIGLGVLGLVWIFRNPPAGLSPFRDTADWDAGAANYNESVKHFARAIAYAEGFGIPGAIPTVANNPGDLVLPGWTPTMGSAGIAVFDSPEYGWARLYRQIALIVSGGSRHYNLNTTLAQMGHTYAGGDPNWARNVASYLNVSTATTIGQVLA